MSKLLKLILTLQTLQKFNGFPLQYKLIIACLFPLIILSSCTVDPAWIFPYINNENTNQEAIVTVEWDPNTEPDLAGYKIYFGLNSGIYDSVIDVGNTTICTISNLNYGETYYISATAYNSFGLESDFSTEIEYTVPLI